MTDPDFADRFTEELMEAMTKPVEPLPPGRHQVGCFTVEIPEPTDD